MAWNDGPFVGESLPLVVPVVDNATGNPIENPTEVRIWLEGPDGSVLGDKTLSGLEVTHLGGGLFRGVFVATTDGVYRGRSMVTGPDGLKKGSSFEFEVYPL